MLLPDTSTMERQYGPGDAGEGSRNEPQANTRQSAGGIEGRVRIRTRLVLSRTAERNNPGDSVTLVDYRYPVPGIDDEPRLADSTGGGAGRSGDSDDMDEDNFDENNESAARRLTICDRAYFTNTKASTNGGDEDEDEADDDTDMPPSSSGAQNLWVEQIYGSATWEPVGEEVPAAPGRKRRGVAPRIASCTASLIRRDWLRESFCLEMEEHSPETSNLAFELFDRYGRLDREYREHDFKKGTGVWGKEFDHGDLLVFDEPHVDTPWRRRGLGSRVVEAILQTARQSVAARPVGLFTVRPADFFAVVRPGWLDPEYDDRDEMRISRNFWRSLGFRRIGTSPWFARADSPDHPSRRLEAAQDWEWPGGTRCAAPLSDNLKQLFRDRADVKAEEIVDLLRRLQETLPEGGHEDQLWQMVDQDGDTVLHVAAMCSKPELVKFVLSKASHLAAVRNKEGYTPAEALRSLLERRRVKVSSNGFRDWAMSDKFRGFDAPSVECLAILENVNFSDLSTLSTRDIEAIASATDEQVRTAPPELAIAGVRETLRLRCGCTCGSCVGGFLSPRMNFVLQCVATVEYDMLGDEMHLAGPEWVDSNDYLLEGLPAHVRENLKTNKSMREGFTNLWDHFAECLWRRMLPSEQVIIELALGRGEWPPVTRNFLERGGTVASVVNTVFETARNEDEWAGTGQHRQAFNDKIDALPECRNDHEFGFVSSMCGFNFRERPADN